MIDKDIQNIKELRKNIFLTAYPCTGGLAHLASAFSVVEVLYTLYMKGVLKYKASDPLWGNRDRLIMSKGHAISPWRDILQRMSCLRSVSRDHVWEVNRICASFRE